MRGFSHAARTQYSASVLALLAFLAADCLSSLSHWAGGGNNRGASVGGQGLPEVIQA